MIQIQNLEVRFKNVYAVRKISFEIKEGETLGIVGESGSGKSVTALSIIRLIPNAEVSGEILFEGRNLLTLTPNELKKLRGQKIGFIFQDPMSSLNPTMSVGKQILEALFKKNPTISKNEAQQKGLELLELVEISKPTSRFEQYPHELSGGIRQRVMIAIALAQDPKLLIADEPTTSLDVTVQAQILHLLKEIQKKRKMSILLITHDLSLVASFCDRVSVMYAGKIVESASVFQIFAKPSHPYTQKLLSSIPRLDLPQETPLNPIFGSPPNLCLPLQHCAFCPRCDKALKICALTSPPHFKREEGHFVSCHLYDPRNRT